MELSRQASNIGFNLTYLAITTLAEARLAPAMARDTTIEAMAIYFHEIDRLSDPAERSISCNGIDDIQSSTWSAPVRHRHPEN